MNSVSATGSLSSTKSWLASEVDVKEGEYSTSGTHLLIPHSIQSVRPVIRGSDKGRKPPYDFTLVGKFIQEDDDEVVLPADVGAPRAEDRTRLPPLGLG